MTIKIYNIQILTDEGWQNYDSNEYPADIVEKELKWLRTYSIAKFRKKCIGIKNRVTLTTRRPIAV